MQSFQKQEKTVNNFKEIFSRNSSVVFTVQDKKNSFV